MADKGKLETAVYAACLAAALQIKDEIKLMSWIGANHAGPRKMAA